MEAGLGTSASDCLPGLWRPESGDLTGKCNFHFIRYLYYILNLKCIFNLLFC